ncbi:salicylic acid-binding protein 2-like [Macadamia integrifolia]|uniref:salicylic acid-binding protein 2-like n=1 Tax=Macadamia integrifolia TaxID=60698 RepID=UPI001C52D5AF|nr:salicylic acid-binding protein 2-like [Macadamia integrifolia]
MKHFVLVHGAGHGAWTWYKVVTLLRSAGHRVTALDLGGSGVNPKRLDELGSIFDYLQPLIELMESLPEEEQVTLVGHSLGGFGISLAMEQFPDKISVAVFITALMPSYTSPPAAVLQEFFKRTPLESVIDCVFSFDRGPENLPTSVILGPQYLASIMYQCSPSEDLTLATMLVRPTSYFIEDLSKEKLLSKEKFGSVDRFYIICDEDKVVKEDFQQWMIENNPTKEVKVIAGADHMVMLSKPQELCLCLKEIASKYD